MEEKFGRYKLSHAIAITLVCTLTTIVAPPTLAYSNSGYSADPSNTGYGTHDLIAQHALDGESVLEFSLRTGPEA